MHSRRPFMQHGPTPTRIRRAARTFGARPVAAARTRASLSSDDRGANLVEYTIVVGVVALVALVGFRVFGAKVDGRIRAQAACVESLDCVGQSGSAPLSPPGAMASQSSPTAAVGTGQQAASAGSTLSSWLKNGSEMIYRGLPTPLKMVAIVDGAAIEIAQEKARQLLGGTPATTGGNGTANQPATPAQGSNAVQGVQDGDLQQKADAMEKFLGERATPPANAPAPKSTH